MIHQTTCYEVAGRMSEALDKRFPGGPRFYVLGGIATAALADPAMEYDAVMGNVNPTTKSDLPVLRPNRTRRDVDVFINSTEDPLVKDMAAVAREAVAGDLKTDVFGVDIQRPKDGLLQRAADLTVRYWTSRRELAPDGRIMHVLKPYSAAIPGVALDPWTVNPATDLPSFPMLDPRYHMLCYDLRSIGGPRPKDQEKLEPVRCLARVMSAETGTADIDYQELDAMNQDMRQLRAGTFADALTNGELGYKIKSGLSYFGEKQEWVVNAFQTEMVQKSVRRIVGSK